METVQLDFLGDLKRTQTCGELRASDAGGRAGSEYVIAGEGVVQKRTPETVNPNIPTGEIELEVSELWILNESRTPPFPMEETVDVKEDVRLKNRSVDLSRTHMPR